MGPGRTRPQCPLPGTLLAIPQTPSTHLPSLHTQTAHSHRHAHTDGQDWQSDALVRATYSTSTMTSSTSQDSLFIFHPRPRIFAFVLFPGLDPATPARPFEWGGGWDAGAHHAQIICRRGCSAITRASPNPALLTRCVCSLAGLSLPLQLATLSGARRGGEGEGQISGGAGRSLVTSDLPRGDKEPRPVAYFSHIPDWLTSEQSGSPQGWRGQDSQAGTSAQGRVLELCVCVCVCTRARQVSV